MSGRIALAGGTGLATALATMKPSDIPDPARWPEGVLLQEADLDVTLARPGAFLGTSARDPVAGALAAKVVAGGPASWHVTMRPSRPVPVRDLPAILAGAGADARLGLVAQIRDIVIPSQGAMAQPAGMDRSTSAQAVGR